MSTLAHHDTTKIADAVSDSGDAPTNYGGRIGSSKTLDVAHGVVLYVENVSVSFDGFNRDFPLEKVHGE